MKDLEMVVHDHLSRRITLGNSLGPALTADIRAQRAHRRRFYGRSTRRRRDRKLRRQPRSSIEFFEYSGPTIDRCKQFRVPCHVFRVDEEKKTAGQKREMKQRNDKVLQLRIQVDQEVAAGNQIELGERCILDEIMLGKDAHLAQLFYH